MAVSDVVRWYLLLTAAFELMPLAQLWLLDLPVHSAFPYAAAHNHNSDLKMMVSMFLAILVIVRVAGFAAGRALTRSHKWGLVLVHAAEVLFILPMYLENVVPRRALMPADKRVPIDAIAAIICINPFVFALLRTARMVPRKSD
jgi:hypothetical protein